MSINTQQVNINFSQGLDTKTDPWQVPIGKFETLVNSIFQKGGLLQKRDGYGLLVGTSPPATYLTTLNDNLLAIGNTVNAYSESLQKWITKGTLQPCSLSTLPLVRNNYNILQADSTVSNNLVCTAYTESLGGSNSYLFTIADSTTGQNITPPTAIPVISGGTISGSSRVFTVGPFFTIVSQVLVSGVTYLQYVSVPVNNPVTSTNTANVSVAQKVHADVYVPISSNPGWDAYCVNGSLVLAWNTTTGGQSVVVVLLTAAQIVLQQASTVSSSFTGATDIAAIASVCADVTVTPNIFYISFWNNSNQTSYTGAISLPGFGTITQVFTPRAVLSPTTITNIASAAQNDVCTVFLEVLNSVSYSVSPTGTTSLPSNYIDANTITSTGTVGTAYPAIRSVGLASKAFIVDSTLYFLSAYESTYQPSYFLINGSSTRETAPIVVAKLAYQNGVGYSTLGLSTTTLTDQGVCTAYLYKDDVQALNTLNNTQQTTAGGIYSQYGTNLAIFGLGTENVDSAEIASNLHLTGGYLSQFDGYLPVEHNFFIWPDLVGVAWSTTGGTMAAVPTGGTEGAVNYYYMATYEWTDNQGLAYRSTPSIPSPVTTSGTGSTGSVALQVPTLRLTAKISSPVKIVIYRWSENTQVYNQITSITVPLINSTSTDYVAYVDTMPDAAVVGNNIIYTTGGVVPDTNAPASNGIVTLFDTRLWLVDAEDSNLLWVSKQVIEDTPVEMSSDFTIYVAPNIGTVASTGPITGLAPMDDKLCIFKANSIYYINGTGPDNLGTTAVGCPLGQYSQPTFITAAVGCTNQQSIVLTPNGLMFQSDKGIWILDRNLTSTYIGAPVEAYNSSLVTSAQVIPETNYVLFTLSTGEMLMYDYYYGQWGVFEGAPSISSCIYQGLHTLLSQYGLVLQQTPGIYLDGSSPVLLKFTTGWINLATLQGYQRFYEFMLLGKFMSPHYLNIQIGYDYNPSIFQTTLINPLNYSSPLPSPFGVPTPFGAFPPREQWRIHAKQQLCQSFQLTIQEVYNPNYGNTAGAGFTMSGINATVGIKKGRRPIPGSNAAGLS